MNWAPHWIGIYIYIYIEYIGKMDSPNAPFIASSVHHWVRLIQAASVAAPAGPGTRSTPPARSDADWTSALHWAAPGASDLARVGAAGAMDELLKTNKNQQVAIGLKGLHIYIYIYIIYVVICDFFLRWSSCMSISMMDFANTQQAY